MPDINSAEALQQLSAIKVTVYAVLVVVIIPAVANTLRVAFIFRQEWFKSESERVQIAAEDLIQRDRVDEAVELLGERLAKRPNDAMSRWQLAGALNLKGRPDEAIEELRKVERLAPIWKREYVEPFIEALREQEALPVPNVETPPRARPPST